MNKNINLVEELKKIEDSIEIFKKNTLESISNIQKKINEIKNPKEETKLEKIEREIKNLDLGYLFHNDKLDLTKVIRNTNAHPILNKYLNELHKKTEGKNLGGLLTSSVEGYIHYNTSIETIELFLKLKANPNVARFGTCDLLTAMYINEYQIYERNPNEIKQNYKILGDLLFKYDFNVTLESFSFAKLYDSDSDFNEFDQKYFDYLVKNINDIRPILLDLIDDEEYSDSFEEYLEDKILKVHRDTVYDYLF